MIKKSDVDRVIIQAEYQSGDRYTIASALKVDPRLGVLILHRQSSPGTAQDMKRLYGSVEKAAERVALVPVPAKEDTPRNRKKYKGKDLALVAVEQQYANATQAKFIDSIVPKSDSAPPKHPVVKTDWSALNLAFVTSAFQSIGLAAAALT
jgi:hypothetical protein